MESVSCDRIPQIVSGTRINFWNPFTFAKIYLHLRKPEQLLIFTCCGIGNTKFTSKVFLRGGRWNFISKIHLHFGTCSKTCLWNPGTYKHKIVRLTIQRNFAPLHPLHSLASYCNFYNKYQPLFLQFWRNLELCIYQKIFCRLTLKTQNNLYRLLKLFEDNKLKWIIRYYQTFSLQRKTDLFPHLTFIDNNR